MIPSLLLAALAGTQDRDPWMVVLAAAVAAFLVGYCLGGLRMYERGAADNDAIHRRKREDRLRALLADLTDESPPLSLSGASRRGDE